MEDNETVVEPQVKDNFTRAEVREAIKNFWFYWYNAVGGTNTEQALDKWMTKNL